MTTQQQAVNIAAMETLADRLKTRRLARLMTRRTLAARAGVTVEQVRLVESGRIQTPHTIRRLAEALACDPLWLAGGIDPAARHAIEAWWDEARWEERWDEQRAAALERAAGLATCGATDDSGHIRRPKPARSSRRVRLIVAALVACVLIIVLIQVLWRAP